MDETNFLSVQKFALPLIGNNLLQLLINQLILFLAINQSVESLAGITTIQSLLYALGGILGAVALAFNIEGGQALGRHDERRFYQLIKSSLLINIMVGLAFILITLGAGELFLTLVYGFSGKMLGMTTIYLLIQSPYILLTLLTFLSGNLLKVENKTAHILWISILSTALEILLNLILVRFLGMGIIGASISSILALLLTVLLQFFMVRHKISRALQEKAVAIKSLLQKSLPLAGQELLEGVIFIIVFEALIARLGVTTLAIYGLCAQVLTLAKMPTYMYENALTIFGAKAYGQYENRAIKHLLKITLVSSIIFYLLISSLIALNARTFASLFATGAVKENFLPYLLVALTCSLGFVFYENFKGILQAINQEKFVLRQAFTVNLVLFLIMIAAKLLNFISFDLLFLLYGTSLLLLSLLLLGRFLGKMKTT